MSNSDLGRRALLQSAAGLAAAGMIGGAAGAAGTPIPPPPKPDAPVTGKGVGDFDFLTGEWTIVNRRFDGIYKKGRGESEGSATVQRVLNGMGSIEQLRGPGGKLRGMGVRVWRPEAGVWADHWTDCQDGVVNPPQLGRFIEGQGVFEADDEMDGKPIKVRAFWDKITPVSCRWYQTMSADGGKTWDYGWYMDWTRVG